MGISNRGTKAKSITSCDNAFVTNIVLARRPQEALLCAKAKRQQQIFYLCESEAAATNILSVRKRSGSNKAPSRNGNQPHVLMVSHIVEKVP
ncbi:hypothetical protein [Lysinibacillus sp. NPDC056232]|uniref:hypothetical protein n=1 Tax=Lysinibacillus sp. NPDC056232 TaxID=3345756 RepID=UPI0035D85BDD